MDIKATDERVRTKHVSDQKWFPLDTNTAAPHGGEVATERV
jgi:hypothetical protein